MSTIKVPHMGNILGYGKRLLEVREATKQNQTAFGAVGGKSKNVQIRYEKEENEPPISYLMNIAKIGCDIQYIVTGVRSTQALTDDEQKLLTLFKKADLGIKAAAMAVLESGQGVAGETRHINNKGQYAEGSITNQALSDIHVNKRKNDK